MMRAIFILLAVGALVACGGLFATDTAKLHSAKGLYTNALIIVNDAYEAGDISDETLVYCIAPARDAVKSALDAAEKLLTANPASDRIPLYIDTAFDTAQDFYALSQDFDC